MPTFVIPMAPTFSLYDVVPDPVPHSPARIQPVPSTRIPDATHFDVSVVRYYVDFTPAVVDSRS